MKALAIAVSLFVSTGLVHAADTKMEMKDMGPTRMAKDDKGGKHKTTGTVQSVDAAAGKVKLAHDPVKSLNWPAMTMNFKVQDKAMLDKLSKSKKVEVEFEQRGKDYVITAVK